MVGGHRSSVAALGTTARYARMGMRWGFMMYPDKVGLPRTGAVAGR